MLPTTEWLFKRLEHLPDGCIVWTKTKDRDGYGKTKVKEKDWAAHRLAWSILVGPIPDGMVICHTCSNKSCCNPDHMYVGTQAQNMLDLGKKSGKPEDIESLFLAGMSTNKIALETGLSRTTVRKYVRAIAVGRV